MIKLTDSYYFKIKPVNGPGERAHAGGKACNVHHQPQYGHPALVTGAVDRERAVWESAVRHGSNTI